MGMVQLGRDGRYKTIDIKRGIVIQKHSNISRRGIKYNKFILYSSTSSGHLLEKRKNYTPSSGHLLEKRKNYTPSKN